MRHYEARHGIAFGKQVSIPVTNNSAITGFTDLDHQSTHVSIKA